MSTNQQAEQSSEKKARSLSWRKMFHVSLALLLLLSMLSGCLYPQSERKKNQGSGLEYIVVVQSAIDQYYQARGVLPIKNFSQDTPLYDRYVIDFKKLLDTPYLSVIPPNAFEKGGVHYYVLVNVEEEPTVKLYDIVVAQAVNDVQRGIDAYFTKHREYPFEELVSPGWYTIDYKRLNMKKKQVTSVYSGGAASLLLSEAGVVAVDYAVDLAVLIRRESLEPELEQDLRAILVEHSPYVPVKSQPYYWKEQAPVIQ